MPPTFYDKVADNIILNIMKLVELVELVLERFQLLKEIESKTQKKEIIGQDLLMIPESIGWSKGNEENIETINNDISSHFLLELYVCKNESDMKWFIRQEKFYLSIDYLYSFKIIFIKFYS